MTKNEKRGIGLSLAGVALAGFAHYSLPGTVGFFTALLALAALAWLIGFATEHLATHTGPGLTSILHTTIGNIPAFLIILFALAAGKEAVAEGIIVGSILSNGLLVLGLVFVAGALASRDGVMRFKTRIVDDTVTLLGIAVMAVALIGTAQATGYPEKAITSASIVVAVLVLILYLAWLKNYLREERLEKTKDKIKPEGKLSLLHSIVLLSVAAGLAALVSEWLVAGINPVLRTLGVSEIFIGLVIIAIAGNASMNYTAVMIASKRKNDLAVALIKNSISQVPAFLYPALVLCSLLVGATLTFALPPILIISLVLSGILIWQIASTGEVDIFGGSALITAFLIIAALLFFL